MARLNQQRKGFTILEVSLVLAITGLILIGIMSGVFSSVARQQYNNSVQSIAERLRVVYNQANNPQSLSDSNGTGQISGLSGNYAIYGKLVLISADADQNNGAKIDSYTIIGDSNTTNAVKTGAVVSDLAATHPVILTDSVDTYTAPWGARLQTPHSDSDLAKLNENNYSISLLIIHSPNGGAVHTYYKNELYSPTSSTPFESFLSNGFIQDEINFCVNSPDVTSAGSTRRNIRLAKDGRNSSAVQLIDVDDNSAGGNQC